MFNLTDAEILFYANEVAFNKRIHLSPMNCSIYVSLVRYIIYKGTFDKIQGTYYVQISYKELSEILGFSFQTFSNTLQKLNECKLIMQNQLCRPYITHVFINELLKSKKN